MRVEHIDTRVDRIAKDLTPAWLLQELGDMAVLVGDDHAIFQGIRHMGQRERGQRLLLLVILDDIRQVIIGQRVATNHEKWLGQLLFRIFDAARRAKRHIFA